MAGLPRSTSTTCGSPVWDRPCTGTPEELPLVLWLSPAREGLCVHVQESRRRCALCSWRAWGQV